MELDQIPVVPFGPKQLTYEGESYHRHDLILHYSGKRYLIVGFVEINTAREIRSWHALIVSADPWQNFFGIPMSSFHERRVWFSSDGTHMPWYGKAEDPNPEWPRFVIERSAGESKGGDMVSGIGGAGGEWGRGSLSSS
jgi:hypothetical protein